MTNYVYIAASLDGYIADADGGIEWLNAIPNPERSDYGWAAFMAGIDAIVMGRVTFETVLAFEDWPYQVPVFVLSSQLSALPEGLTGKVEILSGDPGEITDLLRVRGYRNLYIDGGKTIQDFLTVDQIDELILTRIPILLGRGVPLFGELEGRLAFTHLATETFPNGLVQSRYRRTR